MYRVGLLTIIVALLLGSSSGQDSAARMTGKQVVELLLSPTRDENRKGIQYVLDHKPNVTSEIPRLLEGVTNDNSTIADGCSIGLSSNWDAKAMENHFPKLLDLLVSEKRAARRSATAALGRIAPQLKDRVGEVIAIADKAPVAMESALTVSRKMGLTQKQWIAAWLPMASSEVERAGERVRYAIQSTPGSQKILIQLIKDGQPDSIKVTILEVLRSYRNQPKAIQRIVLEMLEHESPNVRAAAIASLADPPSDWNSTRTALLKLTQDDHEAIQAAATKILFRDPALGIADGQRSDEQRKVVQYVIQSFDDESAEVREAACWGSRFVPGDWRAANEKLLQRLVDAESLVRLAANGALATKLGLARFSLSHDPDKYEKHYHDLFSQAGDPPPEAKQALEETIAEFGKAQRSSRALIDFVEEATEEHENPAIRETLRELQSNVVVEEIRNRVPAHLRAAAEEKP